MTDTPLTQPPMVSSLSGRLLLLTMAFVMLAEVLIFVPSISRFRAVYLEERLAAAELASLALEATPDRLVSEDLAMELLAHAQARTVIIKGPTTRRLVLADDMPKDVDAMYYLSDAMPHNLIQDAFETLWPRSDRTIHVGRAFAAEPGPGDRGGARRSASRGCDVRLFLAHHELVSRDFPHHGGAPVHRATVVDGRADAPNHQEHGGVSRAS